MKKKTKTIKVSAEEAALLYKALRSHERKAWLHYQKLKKLPAAHGDAVHKQRSKAQDAMFDLWALMAKVNPKGGA